MTAKAILKQVIPEFSDKGVADVFVRAQSIDAALDSYEAAVNTGPLQAASEM